MTHTEPLLDRQPSPLPAIWTAFHVKRRLVEAFETELRLPEPRRPGAGRSTWPTMYREFSDIVGWAPEAREAEWASWARARGVHPYEYTRMEEALGWLDMLRRDHAGEANCLRIWAAATACGRPLRKVLKRRGLAKTMFYDRARDGAERIADDLNRHGVAVR